jgi:hypothetical protein
LETSDRKHIENILHQKFRSAVVNVLKAVGLYYYQFIWSDSLFFLVNAVYHTAPMAVPLLQPDLFDICKWEMQCYISLLTVYQFTITLCYVCLQWR